MVASILDRRGRRNPRLKIRRKQCVPVVSFSSRTNIPRCAPSSLRMSIAINSDAMVVSRLETGNCLGIALPNHDVETTYRRCYIRNTTSFRR